MEIQEQGRPELPEDVGQEGAFLIMEEIRKGGVVDSSHQCMVLQMMIMGPEDVCKIRLGPLTDRAIQTLRLIHDAFGVIFKVREEQDGTTLLSCFGIGFKNMARAVT
jgi:RNA 3'-terminal phosphate cyclase-like protein